ncbi:MAG: hypothetical protein R3231_11135 [bacterium]|nr:hypothetical protein [bacterium]
MAVRLEFTNLIVPIENIEGCYPGGFSAFKKEHRHMFGRRLWHDDHLFRDGVRNPMDVESLVKFWVGHGLVPFDEKDGEKFWKEMCVVNERLGGPTLACQWIEIDREENCAYLKGTSRDPVIGRQDMKDETPGSSP